MSPLMTREEAIAALVELGVPKWGEGERAAPLREHKKSRSPKKGNPHPDLESPRNDLEWAANLGLLQVP